MVVIAFLLVGCASAVTHDPETPPGLPALTDYRMTYRSFCGNWDGATPGTTVEVHGEQVDVVRGTYVSQPETLVTLRNTLTSAYDEGAFDIAASISDDNSGFSFSIDYEENTLDDEFCVEVSDVEPLERTSLWPEVLNYQMQYTRCGVDPETDPGTTVAVRSDENGAQRVTVIAGEAASQVGSLRAWQRLGQGATVDVSYDDRGTISGVLIDRDTGQRGDEFCVQVVKFEATDE